MHFVRRQMTGQGVPRIVSWLATGCCTALAFPALAAGSTAGVAHGTLLKVKGTDAKDVVLVSYAVGVPNHFLVDDVGHAGVAPGAGCATVTATEVSCEDTGIAKISLLGLGGPDRLAISSGALNPVPVNIPAIINGGKGADFLDGGLADDTLVGGPSPDKMFGESGADLLKAKDGTRDKAIDCGPGADSKPTFDKGLDPHPVSC